MIVDANTPWLGTHSRSKAPLILAHLSKNRINFESGKELFDFGCQWIKCLVSRQYAQPARCSIYRHTPTSVSIHEPRDLRFIILLWVPRK